MRGALTLSWLVLLRIASIYSMYKPAAASFDSTVGQGHNYLLNLFPSWPAQTQPPRHNELPLPSPPDPDPHTHHSDAIIHEPVTSSAGLFSPQSSSNYPSHSAQPSLGTAKRQSPPAQRSLTTAKRTKQRLGPDAPVGKEANEIVKSNPALANTPSRRSRIEAKKIQLSVSINTTLKKSIDDFVTKIVGGLLADVLKGNNARSRYALIGFLRQVSEFTVYSIIEKHSASQSAGGATQKELNEVLAWMEAFWKVSSESKYELVLQSSWSNHVWEKGHASFYLWKIPQRLKGFKFTYSSEGAEVWYLASKEIVQFWQENKETFDNWCRSDQSHHEPFPCHLLGRMESII